MLLHVDNCFPQSVHHRLDLIWHLLVKPSLRGLVQSIWCNGWPSLPFRGWIMGYHWCLLLQAWHVKLYWLSNNDIYLLTAEWHWRPPSKERFFWHDLEVNGIMLRIYSYFRKNVLYHILWCLHYEMQSILPCTFSKPEWTIGKTIGVIGARTIRLAVPHFNLLIGWSSWAIFPSGNVCSCLNMSW